MLHKRIKYLSQSVPFGFQTNLVFSYPFPSRLSLVEIFFPCVELFYVHPARFKNLTQHPETSGSYSPSSASVNLTKILWRCGYPEVRPGGSREATWMPFSTRLTQSNRISPLPRRCVLIQTTAELLPSQNLRYFLNSDMIIFMARPKKERENLYYTTQGTK